MINTATQDICKLSELFTSETNDSISTFSDEYKKKKNNNSDVDSVDENESVSESESDSSLSENVRSYSSNDLNGINYVVRRAEKKKK